MEVTIERTTPQVDTERVHETVFPNGSEKRPKRRAVKGKEKEWLLKKTETQKRMVVKREEKE